MAAMALWRWVLLGLLGHPLVALVWLLLLVGQPFFSGLAPIPSPRGALDVALAWTFPTGLLGTALGLVSLSRGAPFLNRLDPRTRFRGELGALLAAGFYLQLSMISGALLAGASPLDLGRALPAIFTADLHLASIAILLLLPELPTAMRVSLLLAAAWLVPALFSARESLARVSVLVDASAALRAGPHEAPAALAPAVALTMAAYLLRTGPSRSASG